MSNYAVDGFRPRRLAFADIPAAGERSRSVPRSAAPASPFRPSRPRRQAAIDFAYWIAGGEVQRGPYAAAGGQPGHAAAWNDEAVNAPVGDFFKKTRATLDGGWLRPRHDGYMKFQEEASQRINRALQDGEDGDHVIADLNRAFRGSFR